MELQLQLVMRKIEIKKGERIMIQKLKGTRDILPKEVVTWQYIEAKAKDLFERYGYNEIRTPIIESLDLFQRGVGETTDVVQKEMYNFEDKGGRKIALRPEGTAGVVRAYIEDGLSSEPSPLKLWYKMSMYRYENVQKGRQREFNQIGVELFGSDSYMADVEIIQMCTKFFEELNIKDIELNINSIGCPKCRNEYKEALKDFIRPNLDKYCDTCKTRFEKNPMRILDCKEETCKKLNQNAPRILDYLCEECKTHFENLKNMLNELGIEYKVDSNIVRGLDYYTKTVFEFISKIDGLTVLGGGRYDGLAEELDGPKTPAIGFATGMERLIDVFGANNKDLNLEKNMQKTEKPYRVSGHLWKLILFPDLEIFLESPHFVPVSRRCREIQVRRGFLHVLFRSLRSLFHLGTCHRPDDRILKDSCQVGPDISVRVSRVRFPFGIMSQPHGDIAFPKFVGVRDIAGIVV